MRRRPFVAPLVRPHAQQNGAIASYEVMREFTKNLKGSYQAHHILEEAMARKLELAKNFDKLPAVILTEAQHKKITQALALKRPKKLGHR